MDWRIIIEENNICKSATGSAFNERLDVCMENIFSMPKVGHFEKMSSGSLMLKYWENEETPTDEKTYRLPCHGDSGGSSWITNGYNEKNDDKFKYVIGAINVRTGGRQIADGKWYSTPCGSFATHSDPYTAISQKTTTRKIFTWIKSWVSGSG